MRHRNHKDRKNSPEAREYDRLLAKQTEMENADLFEIELSTKLIGKYFKARGGKWSFYKVIGSSKLGVKYTCFYTENGKVKHNQGNNCRVKAWHAMQEEITKDEYKNALNRIIPDACAGMVDV